MNKISTIGLDIGKYAFQLHGVDDAGRVVLKRRLKRDEVLGFFAKLPSTSVGIEACAGAQHWARELGKLGHEVRLVLASYVKAYAPRQKTDAVDAAAICEASRSAYARLASLKSEESQALRVRQKARELLMRQRVMLIAAIRSHLMEFGIVAPAGKGHARRLIERLCEPKLTLPEAARQALSLLADQLAEMEEKIDTLDRLIAKAVKEDERALRLMSVPGIGPQGAAAILSGVDPSQFRKGRDFAAFLGLVPRQNSSGAKTRFGKITKMGDRTLRRLFVSGAMSVIAARRRCKDPHDWLARLLAAKPVKLVAVALANKMARIVHALIVKNESYRLVQELA